MTMFSMDLGDKDRSCPLNPCESLPKHQAADDEGCGDAGRVGE